MKLFPGRTYSTFLVREFLKVLFICILFIMGLSYIVRTLQRSGSRKNYTVVQTLIVHVFDAPDILLREALMPSCMFASVYVMSNLSKNREILALRSCAVSVYRIITPLILVGCAITAFSLYADGYLLIASMTAKDDFEARLRGEEKKSYVRDSTNVVVHGENNTIFRIDRYVHASMEMQGVVVLHKDRKGKPVRLTNAEKAVWNGDRWVLEQGVVYTFDGEGNLSERRVFGRLVTDMKDDPKYFGRDVRKVQNMRLGEGWQYIKMSRKMGLPYKGILTKYHGRVAQSVTLLFVTVIGLALGSMAFRNAFVMSFSITLGFILVFFFVIEIGQTFGSNGAIPPVLGGWLGNLVFLGVSVYLLGRLRV